MARAVSIFLLVFLTITLTSALPNARAEDDTDDKPQNHVPQDVANKQEADQKPAPPSAVKPALKIADSPACADDVRRLCAESTFANNFAVLGCLQYDRKVK